MAGEEESGFSFVDKRRVNPEGEPPAEPPQAAESADSPPADRADWDPDAPPEEADLPRLSVRDRLLMSIDILHQGAWIAMGLVTDPGSGQVERNMDDARIAIDCVAFLAQKAEAHLDDATRREVQRVVSDLQVNYVQQLQK